jgi:hypothetical protein
MEKILILLCICTLSFSAKGSFDHGARIAFPLATELYQSEVKSTRVDVATGLSFDWWMFKQRNFLLGPGISLWCILPSPRGNQMVAVSPYSLLGEFRAIAAYRIFDEAYDLMPYFSTGSQLGGLIVNKYVVNEPSVNGDILYGLVLSLGLAYWHQDVGLGLSYAMIVNNLFLRHRGEVSLQLALNFSSQD